MEENTLDLIYGRKVGNLVINLTGGEKNFLSFTLSLCLNNHVDIALRNRLINFSFWRYFLLLKYDSMEKDERI